MPDGDDGHSNSSSFTMTPVSLVACSWEAAWEQGGVWHACWQRAYCCSKVSCQISWQDLDTRACYVPPLCSCGKLTSALCVLHCNSHAGCCELTSMRAQKRGVSWSWYTAGYTQQSSIDSRFLTCKCCRPCLASWTRGSSWRPKS